MWLKEDAGEEESAKSDSGAAASVKASSVEKTCWSMIVLGTILTNILGTIKIHELGINQTVQWNNI